MKRPFRLRFFVAFFILSLCLLAVLDWKLFSNSKDVATSELTLVMQDVVSHPFNEITPGAGELPKTLAAYGFQVDEGFQVANVSPNGDEQEPQTIVASIDGNKTESYGALENIEPASGRGVFSDNDSLNVRRAASSTVLKTSPPVDYNNAPQIAIIIDDVGMDIAGSKRAVNLPSPVTIAILPYAERAKSFATQAKGNGHELIIHTPMEAMDSSMNLGSLALRSSYSDERFTQEMDKILSSFDGYVGVNNHMGSRLTQDSGAMGKLMTRLKREGLFFVDSRTIHTSVAAQTAEAYGVPFATRDVFLDHEETDAFVSAALKKVERIARQRGSAIAIGHPKDVTMAGLEAWMLGAQNRGFEFVPVSALVKRPAQAMAVSVPNPVKSGIMTSGLGDIEPASGQPQRLE